MLSKEEILKKNGVYFTDLISSSTMGGIEAAMDEYAKQNKGELITWIEGNVKEYDAISESKTGAVASYYLGKASGANEVKLFLSGLPIVSDNPPKQ